MPFKHIKRKIEREIYRNTKLLTVQSALKQTGELVEDFIIPKGSLIIPNRQPEAPLIAAILVFDADIDESFSLSKNYLKSNIFNDL